MDYPIWLWTGFGVFVLVVLWIDLGLLHRRAHAVSTKEASIWYGVWVGSAFLFGLGILLWLGKNKALEFLAAYTIELSLSVDNIFVFLVIFSDFGVPARYQHRVLFYGILGALILRGVFIAGGVTLLNTFHWIVFVFGAFLIFTGIRIALRKEKEIQPAQNPVFRLMRRFVPVTQSYEGQRFFVRQNGHWLATPLLLVLLVVESTDLVFAIDSVPAVLSITRDPFIVYTSNVFAILGLRALFFLLAGVLHHFRYLKFGLALVLSFVGVKMLVSGWYEIPITTSLITIASILAATVFASYLKTRQDSTSGTQNTGV